MARERQLPAAPLGPDGPYLQAMLAVLDEIADTMAELRDRLPAPQRGKPVPSSDAPRKVQEPAPATAPPKPADEDDEDQREGGPMKVAEFARALVVMPNPPPRVGRGSSDDAWRTWARLAGVTVPTDARRNDIIAACQQAGVLPI